MKDYAHRQDKLTLPFKYRFMHWWKWKGKDLASVLLFIVLVFIITAILPE